MSDRLTPVRNAMADLERAMEDVHIFFPEDLPEDIRWQLHVLACSLSDYTFWVQRVDGGWRATEVETGCSGAVGATPEDALSNYWEGRYS